MVTNEQKEILQKPKAKDFHIPGALLSSLCHSLICQITACLLKLSKNLTLLVRRAEWFTRMDIVDTRE